MYHPITHYQLAKIKQAEMHQDAAAQRLARVGLGASSLPTRPRLATLALVITALVSVLTLLLR